MNRRIFLGSGMAAARTTKTLLTKEHIAQCQLKEIEFKTLPIVRQGLYFRRWDLGA